MSLTRLWILSVVASITLLVSIAGAVNIPAEDLDPLRIPCLLTVTQTGTDRLLEWSSISGATFYRVGYRQCSGVIVGLAELSTTSYVHSGWSSSDCLDYVMVAYDSNAKNICAAIAEDVGGCPCPY